MLPTSGVLDLPSVSVRFYDLSLVVEDIILDAGNATLHSRNCQNPGYMDTALRIHRHFKHIYGAEE